MDISDIAGRSIALLLVGENNEGEPECAVFLGHVERADGELQVNLGEGRGPFPLTPEYLERIEPVKDEVREILLGADLLLSLSVAPLPDDAGEGEFQPLGLRWPS